MSARRAAVLWGVQAPGPVINGSTGPGELAFDEACYIGSSTALHIVITGVVIGGRKNTSIVRHDDGTWHLRHMGHAIPVLHEGSAIDDAVLRHGDVIEPVAVAAAVRAGPCANPRFVFADGAPLASGSGQAVVWSPGRDARIVRADRAFLIALSQYADLVLAGPLLRIRHADGAWQLDHLDRGPPVAIGAHTLQDASCTLRSGDVIEWPGAPPLVFELRDT